MTQSGTSLWQDAWKRLSKNKPAMVSLGFIVFIILVAVLADVLSPYSYETQNTVERLMTPNSKYWMGSDQLGRDLLSRVIYGSRISIAVGMIVAICALISGGIYGAVSGYVGGKIDNAMMRIVDVMYTFPSLLLVILLTVLFGRGLFGICVALTIVSWVSISRLVRGQVLQLKEMQFVEAAHAIGVRNWAIIFKHILPNTLAPVMVSASFGVASAILVESSLSYLGFGVQPPTPSWGDILSQSRDFMDIAWWLTIFPGVAIFITITAFNLVGEGLRDAIDPRLKTGQ